MDVLEEKSTVDKEDEQKVIETPPETRAGRRYKITLTAFLVIVWIVMGLYSTLISVALPDLRTRLCLGTDQISAAQSLKSIGVLIGGIVGGVIVDRYRQKCTLFLAVSLVVVGVSIMIQPHSNYVVALGALFAIEGLAQGFIDTAGNTLVVTMWGAKADAPVHAIHFGYTLGMLITPFMSLPFLSPDSETSSNCTYAEYDNVTVMSSTCIDYVTTESSDVCPVDVSRIEIPYFIAGGVAVLWSLAFWILFFKNPPKDVKYHSDQKTTFKEVFSPGSCADGDTCYAVAMVALFVLYMIVMVLASSPPMNLAFTYLRDTDTIDISLEEATLFAVLASASQMLGRGLTILISHICPIQVLLMSEVIIAAVSITVFVFVGLSNKYVFFVTACIYCFVLAPGWPGGFSWVDKYIVLYAVVVALAGVGAGLSGFGATWLGGYMYDNISRESIFYLSLGASYAHLVVLIIMQILGSSRGTRHKKVKTKEVNAYDDDGHSISSLVIDVKGEMTRF